MKLSVFKFLATARVVMLLGFALSGLTISAQDCSNTVGTWNYYSADSYVGNYEDASTWCNSQPPANGNVDRALHIYGTVNRTGDLWVREGGVRGSLNVIGTFSHNKGATFSVYNGGRIEVWGNLVAKQMINVRNGGTLIVHGNMTVYGSGSVFSGNVVVTGDVYMRNTDVTRTGNLVVGGDFTIPGGGGSVSGDIYVLDPDANVSVPNWSPVTPGDADDFETNEAGNADLNDIVADVGLISAVDEPTSFTFTDLVGSTVDLAWNLNASNNSVIIAYSETDLAGKPTKGIGYDINDNLPDGAIVIYRGALENFQYSGLTPGVVSYFRIWSFTDSDFEYSRAVKLEVRALSSATIFYEDFENGSTGWSLGDDYWNGNKWAVGTAEAFRGDNSAYVSNDNGKSAAYNNHQGSSTVIDLGQRINIPAKYKSAELCFYWKGIAEVGYDGGSVRENTTYLIPDKELAGQETWVERVVDITDYIGTGFDLRFRWRNDGYAGQFPGFCVDEVTIIGSEVARPQSFTGIAASASEVNLTWTKSVDDDNVLIAYSEFGTIGRPESNASYKVGDYLSGGGEVIYVGSAMDFVHSSNFRGKLNYSIWSVKGNVYSSALTTEVNIPVPLPFIEDFEGDVSLWNFNTGYDNAWERGSATANSGSRSAYISEDKGITAGYDPVLTADTHLELDLDLRGFTDATLTFWWKCQGGNNSFGEVYVDNNRLTSSEGRTRYRQSNVWNKETISLSAYVGGIKTLRFRWDNANSGSNPGFCVDDIHISGSIENPNTFSATNSNVLYNDLAWTRNAFPDDVMVAWSPDGVFGSPDEGTIYSVGDVLPGGGTVLYLGDLLSYKHEPLKYSTIYQYKIWSARNGIYSTGLTASANTPEKVIVFSEDWEDGIYPEWNVVTSSGNNSWLKGGADTKAEGSYSAYIRNGSSTTAAYKQNGNSHESWLSVEVDLSDLNQASLNFDWQCLGSNLGGYGSAYGEVYVNAGSGDQRISAANEFYGTTDWSSKSLDLSAYVGSVITVKFRWYNKGWNDASPWDGARMGFCIDNIEVGGVYAATSAIEAGPMDEPASIGSIVNTAVEAIQVFDFSIQDNNSLYNDGTRIQQLVISKGVENKIVDWDEAIAGALLFGSGLDAAGMSGVVTSSGITFTGTDMIVIKDNESASYQLKIWLHQKNLNSVNIQDGDAFDFAINSNDIVTGLGDDFIINQIVESGAVCIDVDATHLSFLQQPSRYATLNYGLSQIPHVAAGDVYGNIDKNFTGNIVITNNGNVTMSPVNSAAYSVAATNGVADFVNLAFQDVGTVMLTAASTGKISVSSDEIIIDQYCVPTPMRSDESHIKNVILNTLNNASGDDGGYGVYLDQQTTLTIGQSYEMNLGVYHVFAGSSFNAWVWIDWDHNGSFDIDERIAVGSTSLANVSTITGSVRIPDDADAVSGTTRMRVQFVYHNNPADACGANTVGESEDYTVIITTEGWMGTSPVWDIPQNWSTGKVPDLATDVFIPDHPYHGDVFPIINGEAKMRDLGISTNAMLTIRPGSQVTVSGDVINQGTLKIENTVNYPASFINQGTITGNSTIQWEYPERRYWYIGHGTAQLQISDLGILSGAAKNVYVYQYNNGWGSPLSDNLVADPLQGYSVSFKDPAIISYEGELNTGDYAKALINGWQIIANPYPSYYQLPQENRVGADFEHTSGSVYVRSGTDKYNRSLATYNTLIGVSSPADFNGVIAPMQAFWVKKTSDGNVRMKQSRRIHDASKTGLKSARRGEFNVLRFHLDNALATDEAVVALREMGSFDLTVFDSEQRFETNNAVPYIYSVKSGQSSVINVLPTQVLGHTVQLGLRLPEKGAGKLRLKVSGFDSLDSGLAVYLEDMVTGDRIDLKTTPEYSFTAEAGLINDRLRIHFEQPISTGINASNLSSDKMVCIYSQHCNAIVEVDSGLGRTDTNARIRIYTISGEIVLEHVMNSNRAKIPLPAETAYYIVEVQIGSKFIREKIVIQP